MKDCILRLYRSAIHVGQDWQQDLAGIRKPGLVFWGEKDSTCPVCFAYELALNSNANRARTFDSEHWVIIERSAEVASALEFHWASVRA